jgi:CspA family cold shock protein
MTNGTVKFFNATKGFGFIQDDETRSSSPMSSAGLSGLGSQKVSYDLESGRDGKSRRQPAAAQPFMTCRVRSRRTSRCQATSRCGRGHFPRDINDHQDYLATAELYLGSDC